MNNRETWLAAFADAARGQFASAGAPLPDRIRMAVGFTSKGARGSRIGECWSDAVSADSTFEIFISPFESNSARVADILTHELVHAAVGLECGHKGAFGRVARALGLEGKLTSTKGGEAWREWALPIIGRLGEIPHAALVSGNSSARPKQTTRMIKLECADCGAVVRASRKVIEAAGDLICISRDCGGAMMEGDSE